MSHESLPHRRSRQQLNSEPDHPGVNPATGEDGTETDEFGLPIARPGDWLPDLDGTFDLLAEPD